MDIQYSLDEEILVAAITGRLEAMVVAEAETSMFDKVDEGYHRWVVDLSQTDYIASAGLRILLKLAKRLKPVGGVFCLCAANEDNHQVLEISGFLSIIDYYDQLDEAIMAIGSAASG